MSLMARVVNGAYFCSSAGPWYACIMKRLSVRHALVTIALLCLAGCYLFPREEKVLAPPLMVTPEVAYSTVEAKKKMIESKTIVSGSFVSVTETPLYFQSGGSRLKRIAVTSGEEVKAGALVAELDTGALENRIAQGRILLRKAQVTLDRATALGRDRFEKELASLDIDLANLQLQELLDTRDESRLVAPVGGRVVYVAGTRPGDLVDAYRTIVQLADPKNLQAVYKGDKGGDFTVGGVVTMTLSDGTSFPGEVTMAPGSTPADAPEDLRGAVVVKSRSLPQSVRIGDSASITRILARRENVIVIPQDLVRTYLGRDFVQVVENGQMKERTIQLGVQTATEVEVKSGLSEGEKILSR